MGHLQKHPKHNLVIKKFTHLDYLLFMDLDKNHFYAIHQKGALTFSDTYMDEAPWALHFTDGAASEKYFMVVYRNGEYAHKTMDGDYHVPEVLIFDWSGKYINGFKLDRFVTNIEYGDYNYFQKMDSPKLQIIGNIHDNPEILKNEER